jgi:rhamnosyl/mannosyltransferase
MKLKVAQICKAFPPPFGGIETVIASMLQGFAGHPDIAIEVIVPRPTFGLSSVHRESSGFPVTEIPSLGTFARTPIAPTLLLQLKKANADVHHFHFPYPWGEVLQAVAGGSRPYLVTYHCDIVRFKLLNMVFHPFMMRFLRRASAIVVSSEKLLSCSPVLGALPADKCHVIPFGLDLDSFRSSEALSARAAQLRARLAGDSPMVLFVGRFVSYKGIPTLLRAMRDVTAVCVLVGTGELEAALREEAQRLDVEDRIRWAGAVSAEDLPIYYHAADLFVLPSDTTAEAFGLVQLEAHACGLPVVCCDVPTGVTDLNRHEETGLVVPMRDSKAMAAAINRLLADPLLRKRLGDQAKERAFRDFSMKNMTRNYADLYRTVAKGAEAKGSVGSSEVESGRNRQH